MELWFAISALGFFAWGFLDFIDLIFIRPPSGIKEVIIRNLNGYLKMAIGYILLVF